MSTNLGALPAGNYRVEIRTYNPPYDEGPASIAYFNVVQRYYVYFLNDVDNTSLAIFRHGHVGLFFYTDGNSNADLDYYFSFGSSVDGRTDERTFSSFDKTKYRKFLEDKGYDRYLVFEIGSQSLYKEMMGKAFKLADFSDPANKYNISNNNCLHNAAKVMALQDSYFDEWAKERSDVRYPNDAFKSIADHYYYKTIGRIKDLKI
jgi:hypothetical protein